MTDGIQEYGAEQEDASSAEAAFDRLCALVDQRFLAIDKAVVAIGGEMAVNRKGVEGILNQIGKVRERLAGIENHPMLQLTPAKQARAIGDDVAAIISTAAWELRAETGAVTRERQALAEIVQGLTRKARGWARFRAFVAGVAVGLAVFPLLGAFAPGGSYLAALAMGQTDRWQAGGDLLQAANAAEARSLAWASQIAAANSEALKFCAEEARRAGKEEICAIYVPASGP